MSYTTNPLVHVLTAKPIDKLAHQVASQKNCVDSLELTKEEIIAKMNFLKERRKHLGKVLFIRNRVHAVNVRARFTERGIPDDYPHKEELSEWLLIGKQYHALGVAMIGVNQKKHLQFLQSSHFRALHNLNAAECGFVLLNSKEESK